MAKLTLYHASPSRSSIVLWMLEELGEPYDIHLLSLSKGENREPAYLAINPMGKVPAIRHGDAVVTEAAAICTYLADEFPAARLNIPIGTPQRGVYLKWLFFGPSCIEPAMTDRAFPRKEEPRRAMLGYGDFDTVMDVVAKAVDLRVSTVSVARRGEKVVIRILDSRATVLSLDGLGPAAERLRRRRFSRIVVFGSLSQRSDVPRHHTPQATRPTPPSPWPSRRTRPGR